MPGRQVNGQAHESHVPPDPDRAGTELGIALIHMGDVLRTSWVPPSGPPISCTSIQLTWPPNSQVAASFSVGRLDRPLALPWAGSARRAQVAGDGQEPAGDALGIGAHPSVLDGAL
jgi:hypothetical protein